MYLKKLLEPFIEIEKRRNRIVIYLFEHQIVNFSTLKFYNKLLNFRYWYKLKLLKNRKVRIGFLVNDTQKWSAQSLYLALKNDDKFEPFIILAPMKSEKQEEIENNLEKNVNFFKNLKTNYVIAFDYKKNKVIPLSKFKPDIVFYQQPWGINQKHSILEVSKYALTAYVPYCFYSLKSYLNYMSGFHGILWKYFVETEEHKKEYETEFDAKNCVVSGSIKFDNYITANKDNDLHTKKRIIYAPHHSFSNDLHEVATFDKNGDFILSLAKKHPEIEWIIKPHPIFKENVIKNNIKTQDEIKNYFSEWEKIGQVFTIGNYYELFENSDGLITDCISFLAEYLPTEKPILHLKKDNPKDEYNDLLKIITESYYKIFDNETLEKTFEDVIINNNDYLKEQRIKNIDLLKLDSQKTVGEKIKNYLKHELKM